MENRVYVHNLFDTIPNMSFYSRNYVLNMKRNILIMLVRYILIKVKNNNHNLLEKMKIWTILFEEFKVRQTYWAFHEEINRQKMMEFTSGINFYSFTSKKQRDRKKTTIKNY